MQGISNPHRELRTTKKSEADTWNICGTSFCVHERDEIVVRRSENCRITIAKILSSNWIEGISVGSLFPNHSPFLSVRPPVGRAGTACCTKATGTGRQMFARTGHWGAGQVGQTGRKEGGGIELRKGSLVRQLHPLLVRPAVWRLLVCRGYQQFTSVWFF